MTPNAKCFKQIFLKAKKYGKMQHKIKNISVGGEISDLTYHILVLMFQKDITVEEVKTKRIERYKIEGNKKIENRQGAY